MKVKSESEVAQSCLTLSDPMDCSSTGSSVHGIFQAVVAGSLTAAPRQKITEEPQQVVIEGLSALEGKIKTSNSVHLIRRAASMQL